ncbi:hypothetical protein M885DRAFT_495055 [Pelagophyceae sp. CCMP2097]|nr:hypothetical protein M885DRAFT_495055 [Pelagophyceae sp. CCMP2097]
MRSFLLLALAVTASALAPTKVAAKKPLLQLQKQGVVAAAAFTTAASNVGMAFAGGQSEGTGLVFGIDDNRELTALALVFGSFFALYFNWAKEQPDSDSDFFGEIDDRRN